MLTITLLQPAVQGFFELQHVSLQ